MDGPKNVFSCSFGICRHDMIMAMTTLYCDTSISQFFSPLSNVKAAILDEYTNEARDLIPHMIHFTSTIVSKLFYFRIRVHLMFILNRVLLIFIHKLFCQALYICLLDNKRSVISLPVPNLVLLILCVKT